MKRTTILLTQSELYYAGQIGLKRRCASLFRGDKERNGVIGRTIEYQWYINLFGAQAEAAFAKGAGLEWTKSVNAPKGEPDVLPNWQVRSSDNINAKLTVRRDDSDDSYYALMTGINYTFTFRGWIRGADAKKKEWFKDPDNRNSPAWFVPQPALLDYEEALLI